MKFLRKFLNRKNRTIESDLLSLYMARYNGGFSSADDSVAALIYAQYLARRKLGLNPMTGFCDKSYSDQTEI